MASIGGFTFLSLEPSLPDAPQPSLMEVHRPRVDGVMLINEGLRPVPHIIRTTTICSTSGQLATLPLSYSTLVGTLVTIVDDFGNSANNVLVKRVATISARTVLTSSPPSAGILEMEWEVQR